METQELFNQLADNGRQSYTDKQGEAWEAAGLALSSISADSRDMARLAYAFYEDSNNRVMESVLNWLFGLYENIYVEQLNYMKRALQKTRKVNVKRNSDDTWEQKTYKMVVTFEEVE